MRLPTLIAWLIGVAILATLVSLNHPGRVLEGVVQLRGWLIVVAAYHSVPLLLDVIAWQRLFLAPPRLAALFGIRWIAEGVNGMLPVPHLGELVRADLTRRISRDGQAGASVVVDLTLGVATQVLFAGIGLALFGTLAERDRLWPGLVLATVVLAVCATSLYFLQRAGLFALAAALIKRWPSAARRILHMDDARALDDRIGATYARPRALLLSAAWRLAGWIAGAGEIWIILYALGHPLGFGEAIILESLSQAARTAAFAIPGGLGVQDGAIVLLCAQLGIAPDFALVVALAKRCRELLLGIPALVLGSLLQARRLSAAAATPAERPPA